MKFLIPLVCFVTLALGAPAQTGEQQQRNLALELAQLKQQLASLERQYSAPEAQGAKPSLVDMLNGWKPQKRMVAWQPMKRSFDYDHAPLVQAVEARLAEVLRAGEGLGVAPEEVLQDLRARNQFN
ncbi:unnamed protein product [Caenorhabditis auriculariae]|uniref:Uncharacterized protein n=1 Tax=Caenorhabditis auriculariae TaxID=2777116 RepID=A0A8S1HM27_9PELO|nr:unnamed protein product [Caenorhabditis auriculariae]